MGAAEDEDESMRGSRGGEKIYVSVRLRPLNDKEIAKNDVSDWECISDDTIIYRNNLPVSERSMYPTAYSFDRVFRPDCSTRKVYEEGAKEVAIAVVSGINSSVFAYGQTSSGKTYTMSGITGYAVADIYDYIEQHREREFTLKFSAMEIYNESVRDLLSTDTTPLRLLDDPERGTVVERITEETLRDWDHFRELLSICEAQRQIGETALNETSSRSHQILRLTIESSACEFLGKEKSSSLSATVNFIDLAGSERASQTSSAGARLKEGCHINRSLLTLGTVIRKLSKGRNGHIPFRDSKLTRILQSSLGGNAKTAIICTMSPARTHVEQSRNTLLFASCAKEVATNARVNVVVSDKALVKQLQRELTRMGEELRSARPVSVTPDSNAALREKDLQIEKLRKQVSDLTQQLEEAHSQFEDLLRGAEEDRSSRLWEDPARHYPRLRVRNSCISDISASYSFISEDPSSVGVGERSFNTSLCSDRQSIASSDENFVQLAHFVEDFRLPKSSNSSPDLLSTTADVTGNDQHENVVEEETYENSDNNCKEVQCISEEQPNTKGCANSDMSQCSTTKGHENSDGSRSSENRYPNSNVSSPDSEICVPELMEESKNRRENEEMNSPSLEEGKESSDLATTFMIASPRSKNGRENKEMNSPPLEEEKESKASTFTIASPDSRNGRENEEMNSPSLDEEKESKASTFMIASPEKTSPWLLKESICKSKSFTLPRSRSCRARLVHNLSVTWSEKESIEGTPPFGYEKDFIGRPESLQRRLPPLKYDHNNESFSRADSQASISTSTSDLKVQTPEALTNSKSTTGSIENGEGTAMDDDIAQETKEKTDESRKDVKDGGLDPIKDNMKHVGLDPIEDDMQHVGLDPIQHEAEDIQRWPSEFKRMQREIIQLWHACNVSLVHRSYFFLLFKGDEADSFYMEVEHRRLRFLKDTFSRGTKTMVDGLALTPASSERGLSQERQMLAREMQRALSKTERENLFLKWGISMSSNNRRLQVVHCLWTRTNDMDHIAESATLVAKIVGFEEQESGMKQMLGLLNISPLCLNRRRTSFWKRSVFSFL